MPARKPAAETSLRERKKEKQRQALIDTATELFRERTFANTRMEDIAAVVEVGVTTVYNYFPSKHELLVAIIDNQVTLAQHKVGRVLDALPEEPVEGLAKMIGADYGNMDRIEDKRLWRELLAVMLFASAEHGEIEQSRNRFREALGRALVTYIERGRLRAECEVEAVVDIVYAIYAYHFRSLACADKARTRDALRLVRRDIEVLLRAHLV
ncbi:TetR/AcrR family transcriptional regulator [Pseudomonas nitroreducens]|uniref:TetR/AcrR family transcriptional regulator n=1 Tax=Pseudomonas nitroreducens TaxID=46680 RepID=UPI00209FA9BC|nr:TetR/AcrR family transcriptional regulator [Pseudomonas nitroreducens]MCP1624964.1 AcrR family transcriptional regulator [Pseudomonas nitroreducens]